MRNVHTPIFVLASCAWRGRRERDEEQILGRPVRQSGGGARFVCMTGRQQHRCVTSTGRPVSVDNTQLQYHYVFLPEDSQTFVLHYNLYLGTQRGLPFESIVGTSYANRSDEIDDASDAARVGRRTIDRGSLVAAFFATSKEISG